MGSANLKIAELYLLKGAYDKSLAYLLEALKFFEKTGMEQEIAYCCEVTGRIYMATDNPQLAVDYYEKAVNINNKPQPHTGGRPHLYPDGFSIRKHGQHRQGIIAFPGFLYDYRQPGSGCRKK